MTPDDSENIDPSSPKRISIRYLIPNLMTLLALCAGLTSLRMVLQDRLEMAGLLILVSAIIDGLDGRIARYLKGTSRFGAELDSLADFVNFGVVPALALYIWMLKDMGSVGWLCVLLYASACGLRLARFNVMDLTTPSHLPPQEMPPVKNYFSGVPAPAGALLAFLPLFIYLSGMHQIKDYPAIACGYLIFVGIVMISRFPTVSIKHLKITREKFLSILIGFVLSVAIFLSFPWLTLSVVISIYLIYVAFLLVRNCISYVFPNR